MFGIGKVAFVFSNKFIVDLSQSAVKYVQYCSCVPPSSQLNIDQNLKSPKNLTPLKSLPHLRYSSTIDNYANLASLPAFDIYKVQIEKLGEEEEEKMVKLIYDQHFAREPSILNLNIPKNNQYLSVLAKKYARASDRWLAYIYDPRTRTRRLIGILSAFLKYQDEADKLYELAERSFAPECHLINFHVQCLTTLNLFEKYSVPCIYDIEVMACEGDPENQLKELMLRHAMSHAKRLCFPLVQVVATSHLTSELCTRAHMTHEWRKNYEDFVDDDGKKIFCPCTCDKAVDLFTWIRRPSGLGFPSGYKRSKPRFQYTPNLSK